MSDEHTKIDGVFDLTPITRIDGLPEACRWFWEEDIDPETCEFVVGTGRWVHFVAGGMPTTIDQASPDQYNEAIRECFCRLHRILTADPDLHCELDGGMLNLFRETQCGLGVPLPFEDTVYCSDEPDGGEGDDAIRLDAFVSALEACHGK